MNDLRTKIIDLLKENKTYAEVANLLGCSKSTVNYHASETSRSKLRTREKKYRNALSIEMRELLGSKCSTCGYDKCQQALDFHHINPATKKFGIAQSIGSRRCKFTKAEIKEEVLKCVLLCANCHRELHAD